MRNVQSERDMGTSRDSVGDGLGYPIEVQGQDEKNPATVAMWDVRLPPKALQGTHMSRFMRS